MFAPRTVSPSAEMLLFLLTPLKLRLYSDSLIYWFELRSYQSSEDSMSWFERSS